MKRIVTATSFILISLIIFTSASGVMDTSHHWSMMLQGQPAMAINQSVYASLANSNVSVHGVNGVPLEIFFYHYGLWPVIAVTVDGRYYDWSREAHVYNYDMPFLVLPDGRIYDGRETYAASRINVTTTARPANSTLELPYSIMYSLGGGGREGLINGTARQIIVYYVDALGYERYEKAKADGIINNIASLGEPVEAACVYPSVSRVNSRALVTGQPANLSRGDFDSKIPDGETIFDRLRSQGKTAIWIDGGKAPVYLENDVLNLHDQNCNGNDRDEIATEVIRQYLCGTNLIIVHFKETDKKGHAYGPESAEARMALKAVDDTIGCLNSALAPGTVVVIYSDHGMHEIGMGGDHGTLLPEDMIVPLIVRRI